VPPSKERVSIKKRGRRLNQQRNLQRSPSGGTKDEGKAFPAMEITNGTKVKTFLEGGYQKLLAQAGRGGEGRSRKGKRLTLKKRGGTKNGEKLRRRDEQLQRMKWRGQFQLQGGTRKKKNQESPANGGSGNGEQFPKKPRDDGAGAVGKNVSRPTGERGGKDS